MLVFFASQLGIGTLSSYATEGSDQILRQKILAPLEKYCVDCHGQDDPEGEINLQQYRTVQGIQDGRREWLKILQQLKTGSMPPDDAQQPSDSERKMLIDWIDKTINEVDCSKPVSPGRVTLRRLNRIEYRNTIRDLLSIDYEPANEFPADDVGYGFDNIGDVLSLPPLLMEKYLAAAQQISRQAMTGKAAKRILITKPGKNLSAGQAAHKVLRRLATRAFRRPVTDNELDRLCQLVDLARQQGDSFETGIQLALQAILVSPHFLFKVELDPKDGVSERTLSDFELATRLSYFLWNSMPDDQLFRLARKSALRQGDNLEQQIQRMLKDPKSKSFITSFAGQWLQLRNLDDMTFDPKTFPGCDRRLLMEMRKETELFFAAIVREDQSILRIVDADFTFVNQRLARHYGLREVRGTEFRRVSLQGTPRGGILTQGAILAVTSNPTRTSPVKRGKFVLDNILGTPPPPPPANVPELNAKGRKLTGTLRQLTEQHRADPACASCHKLMDPLGFAFENFDAVGRWRVRDEGGPIDASGQLPSGEQFSGAAELRPLLLKVKRNDFVQCLTEKTLIYALGRGLQYYDQCAVNKIIRTLEKDDYRFSRLVIEVAKSRPFQMRAKKRS